MNKATLEFMADQLRQGEVQYGETNGYIHRVGSTYPQWFSRLCKKWKVDCKYTLNVIDKMLDKSKLTIKQARVAYQLNMIAETLECNMPELINEIPLSWSEIIQDKIENVIYLQHNWEII